MKQHHERIKLSDAEAALLLELVADSPAAVRTAAKRAADGQVVPDDDAEAVVDVLCNAMLGDEGFDGEALTTKGIEIDAIIGIVQQMSEHFYE